MAMLRRIAGIVLLLALSLAACGDDDGTKESLIVGDSLTVYSSLPMRGTHADVARDLVLAEKLALKEAGGKAGPFTVAYVALDSADPETQRWSPARVASNARVAVQDRQTIAYLGELETGASAISVPILNEGGILQVSPRDTFGGLTARGARGEPEKYYPSGRRTFARMVPGDDEQARALVDVMRSQGVRRILLADDREVAGVSLGDRVTRLAPGAGIEVVERRRMDPDDDVEDGIEVPDGIVRDVRRKQADAFLYAGTYRPFAAEVLKAVHAEDPSMRLYGTDDLALAEDLPEQAGAAADRLVLTAVRAPRDADAQAFARRFEAAYGKEPHPQAVLGYKAMRLVLDAIRRAGPDATSRRKVTQEALRQAKGPRATFGSFRIEGTRLVPAGSRL
jgi:branched-chain amino acid transport system substrate-binding protein